MRGRAGRAAAGTRRTARAAATLLAALALAPVLASGAGAAAVPGAAAAAADDATREAALSARELTTVAERSRWTRTGRYAEVEALCRAYAVRWPASARCVSFGTTPEGRPMLAIVASADGALAPADARARGRPVVFVQAGIHAGEIEGKDAGLAWVRDALAGRTAAGALARATFVFVPVLNVDGHERFRAWNRPNQDGPAETGWRATAQNLNLNRDYAKADAPETRALLAFLNAWDPVVYADLHTTDGADFRHDVSIQVQPDQAEDAALAADARALRDGILARLAARGSLPLHFYPSFRAEDRPESGFTYAPYAPRFQTGYWPQSGRVALLVETHSWKDYATRVRVNREFLDALVAGVAAEPARWVAAARDADARAIALAGTHVELAWENTDESREIDFLGYAWSRTPSAVSGALAIAYDRTKPATWRAPLYDRIRATLTVDAPRGGYVVPAAYAADLAPRLEAHGIAFERWSAPRTGLAGAAFAVSEATYAARPFEGRTRATLSGEWRAATVDVAAGALYVPIAQPKARLVLHLFEPRAPDSFVAWGLMNGAFERKEYLEAYVTEPWAREALARDPALAREFEARLLADRAFATSPAARLEFFARRHPSWDGGHETYPVLRVDALR